MTWFYDSPLENEGGLQTIKAPEVGTESDLPSGQEWGLLIRDRLPSFTSFTFIDLEFLFQCIIGNIYLTLGLNVLLSGLDHMWQLKIIPVS